MAQVTEVRLIDDLNGGPAEETIQFEFDGKPLEIDLNEANAEKFRELLAPFIEAARRGTNGVKPRPSTNAASRVAAATKADKEQSQAIRRWAWDNGYPELAERGRIAQYIQEDYHAHGGRAKPKFVEPEAIAPDKTWDDLDEEERSEVMAWVASLGHKWPTRSPKRKNLAIDAFRDHDTARLAEVLA